MSTSHDGRWLDRMYNNRELVPEHPEHFRRWAAESAAVPRTQACELDVRYGGGPNEHLDIFPAEQADAPVLVFIHGGYWRALDKRDHSFVAPPFTRARRLRGDSQLRPVPGRHDPADHDADGAGAGLDLAPHRAPRRRPAPHHGGGPFRRRPPGRDDAGLPVAGLRARAAGRPGEECGVACPGCTTSIRSCTRPFCSPRCSSRASRCARPARRCCRRPPRARCTTVCGGDESEEFLRQNRLIREAWGEGPVPVCEALPGLNHFSVLEALVAARPPPARAGAAAAPALRLRGRSTPATSAGARRRCRRPGSRSSPCGCPSACVPPA